MPPLQAGVGECVYIPPKRFSPKGVRLCYIVRMSDRFHISVRVSGALLKRITEIAVIERRSRSSVIVNLLEDEMARREAVIAKMGGDDD